MTDPTSPPPGDGGQPYQQPPQYSAPPPQAPPPPMSPPAMPPPGQGYGQQAYGSAPPPAPGYGYGQGGPGMAPPGMYYDQASGLTLPNGTTLAPVGRRIGAYFLAIPLAIVTLLIGYVIWGLVLWGQGTTPALKVLGMKVWKPDSNSKATFGTMALREIVGRIVDGILSFITLLISFILFVTGKEHKALHDIVASTVVLHDPNKVLG